jgi:thiamine phosphate synthase YjbQ (UPF0047 family)
MVVQETISNGRIGLGTWQGIYRWEHTAPTPIDAGF